MTALDTNVLVRYLVRDDAKQARQAKSLIERLDTGEARAFVSDIVLCELCWVLAGRYGFDRLRIVAALRGLAGARQLRFHSTDNVVRAIEAYAAGKGDFADYMIREQARGAGCTSVATFDKELLADAMFAALP